MLFPLKCEGGTRPPISLLFGNFGFCGFFRFLFFRFVFLFRFRSFRFGLRLQIFDELVVFVLVEREVRLKIFTVSKRNSLIVICFLYFFSLFFYRIYSCSNYCN